MNIKLELTREQVELLYYLANNARIITDILNEIGMAQIFSDAGFPQLVEEEKEDNKE